MRIKRRAHQVMASTAVCGVLLMAGCVSGQQHLRPSNASRSTLPVASTMIGGSTATGESLSASSSRAPTEPSTSCGTWLTPASTVGQYFTDHYGEIRNCGLFGTQWVISTLGFHGTSASPQTGVLGVYPCKPGETSCLDGQSPYPVAGWKVVTAPYPGALTVLGYPELTCIILDDEGHQLAFNLTTDTFQSTCSVA